MDTVKKLQNTFLFSTQLGELYSKGKAVLPYHINLIDEIGIGENAHSRIFAKLLRYNKGDNKFPLLEKFLREVCKFNLSVKTPKIKKVDSCGRIDIPIFDDDYVVIIENKVTNKAPDQNGENGGQLARYIETIESNYGKNIKQIYVVYMPQYTREPSDECWKNKDGHSYKDEFKDRFCSVSYKSKIYPWLKYKILPSIEEKDRCLCSAIVQYIDHLEGIFGKRNIDEKMNTEIKDFIRKELELSDDTLEEALEKLKTKEKELNDAINYINLLKEEYQKSIVSNYFNEWKEKLEKEYSDCELVEDFFKTDENIINIGIKFSIEKQVFNALIECNDCSKPNIYIGIKKELSNDEYPEVLKDFEEDTKWQKGDNWWHIWKYTSSSDNTYRYQEFVELIKNVQGKIATMPTNSNP